ncbi:choice-of-anchor J domain-containing protein [Labilibacter marinus]|uniref:choice-of-anchor J domain-containing protein n=1 Tax=Labilibacter marinus TaxID=1477105 RepID=UPI00117BC04E|nr:choice-of-anchor J domain-containing protein [Labilibacter marinus]
MKKLQYILFALMALFAFACEPLEDIKDELDDNYHGPLNKEIKYELTASDYKSISESAAADATTAEELEIAESVLEGDTALTADLASTYIPEMLGNMESMYGYAPKSLNKVSYKFRETVEEAIVDSTTGFFKFSLYSWMVFPEPGYMYDFNDGTSGEDVDKNGWTQYNLGSAKDMTYIYKSFGGNSYAYVTAYKGKSEGGYKIWMVSPALNLDKVFVAPNLKFENAIAYPNGAVIKAYVMNDADPAKATLKEELVDAVFATEENNNYEFISSGMLDLSDYSGTVYIGFEYVAEKGQTTSFCIDDFTFDYIEL